MVTAPFLGEIDRAYVWTEREPISDVDSIFSPPNCLATRYRLTRFKEFYSNFNEILLGCPSVLDCRPRHVGESPLVLLFVSGKDERLTRTAQAA